VGLWFLLGACVTALLTGLAVARRRLAVVTVNGTSMAPSFRPGDRLIVRRGAIDRISIGTVVVLRMPDHAPARPHAGRTPARYQRAWAMKRVAALAGDVVPAAVRDATRGVPVVPDGMVVVLADHPAGADSRLWGFVPVAEILGPVIGVRLARRVSGD
jgi:signal peptidase I